MCKVFYYKNVTFSPETGVLTATYGVDDQFTFTETVTFPGAPFCLTPADRVALASVFRLAHIALGISYYKAFLPEKIQIETEGLTSDEAHFFERFYEQGLGEFAVRNGLNLQGKIHFPSCLKSHDPVMPDLTAGALVPVGGGKDSCLTLSLLKEMGVETMAIAVGNARPIRESIAVAEVPAQFIERHLDPLLLELNATGKVKNGHVPITGVLAFLLWGAAILYHRRYVVMSCERSANVGNMMQGKMVVNHQYSKSLAFETDFYRVTQTITPNFRYFSLLRPLSEAHIAKLFAQKCAPYFPVFTSCNKAFKLDPKKRLARWCGQCDKCRFVFLILAPFMDKKTLVDLVGCNPLNDPEQVEGFRELLGVAGHKPFECVGEIEESRWAFAQLKQKSAWQQDHVVRALAESVAEEADSGLIFEPSTSHLIPEEFKHVLDLFKR